MANLETVVHDEILFCCKVAGEILNFALRKAPLCDGRLLACQSGVQIRNAFFQQRVCVNLLLVCFCERGVAHLAREAADQVRL